MIFWKGNRIYNIISDTVFPEAMYLDYNTKVKIISKGVLPRGFTIYFATVFRNKIQIRNGRGFPGKKTNINPEFNYSIPIVSEYDDINSFPERFAIRTKNIDLLRELNSRGKKVTWLEPDIYTQANWLGILSFEHVFIDPYINTHIVFPTGEIVLAKDYLWFNPFKNDWHIKHSKKIGFYTDVLRYRMNWKVYCMSRAKKGKVNRLELNKQLVVNMYNIHSITYLIWRQSKLNARTVPERDALIG